MPLQISIRRQDGKVVELERFTRIRLVVIGPCIVRTLIGIQIAFFTQAIRTAQGLITAIQSKQHISLRSEELRDGRRIRILLI